MGGSGDSRIYLAVLGSQICSLKEERRGAREKLIKTEKWSNIKLFKIYLQTKERKRNTPKRFKINYTRLKMKGGDKGTLEKERAVTDPRLEGAQRDSLGSVAPCSLGSQRHSVGKEEGVSQRHSLRASHSRSRETRRKRKGKQNGRNKRKKRRQWRSGSATVRRPVEIETAPGARTET